MSSQDQTNSRSLNLRKGFHATLCAVSLCGLWILAACSGSPSNSIPTTDASIAPNGGIEAPASEILDANNPPAATPTSDAAGVYPPPESKSISGNGDSKAVTPSGTDSIFLPAIINEKPPLYPFEIQQTGVLAVQGFFGCNWSGVAGQVFNQTEVPIQNLIVHLEGFWNGNPVSKDALTGSATQYGPAGYEFVLGDQLLDSNQALWIQLRDAGQKNISARVYLDTHNDCSRNLILVNFIQVR
jgi:hypothetical protein